MFVFFLAVKNTRQISLPKADISFLNKTFHSNFYKNDFSAACLYCNIDKNVTVLLPFLTRICDTRCEHVSIKRFSLVPLFFSNPLISFCNPVPLSTQPAHTLTHSHAHTHTEGFRTASTPEGMARLYGKYTSSLSGSEDC